MSLFGAIGGAMKGVGKVAGKVGGALRHPASGGPGKVIAGAGGAMKKGIGAPTDMMKKMGTPKTFGGGRR